MSHMVQQEEKNIYSSVASLTSQGCSGILHVMLVNEYFCLYTWIT